jgi:hypothetical protein
MPHSTLEEAIDVPNRLIELLEIPEDIPCHSSGFGIGSSTGAGRSFQTQVLPPVGGSDSSDWEMCIVDYLVPDEPFLS